MEKVTIAGMEDLDCLRDFILDISKKGSNYKITKRTKLHKKWAKEALFEKYTYADFLQPWGIFIPNLVIDDLNFRLINNKLFLNTKIFKDEYKKNELKVLSNKLQNLRISKKALLDLEIDQITIDFNL